MCLNVHRFTFSFSFTGIYVQLYCNCIRYFCLVIGWCDEDKRKYVPHREKTCASTVYKINVVFFPVDPTPYCRANPFAVVPHPDNCHQYIDCRQMNTPLGNYLQECPYPLLVSENDTNSGTPCQSFDLVNCGMRSEPKSPCMLIIISTDMIRYLYNISNIT